jgi:hypothetical protein
VNKLLDTLTLKGYRNRRKAQQSQEQHNAELLEINNAYYRLFTSDDGKFILDHLVRTQLTGAIAMQGDNYLDIGEKQGRANLVQEIIMRVERAKTS